MKKIALVGVFVFLLIASIGISQAKFRPNLCWNFNESADNEIAEVCTGDEDYNITTGELYGNYVIRVTNTKVEELELKIFIRKNSGINTVETNISFALTTIHG